MHHYRSVKDVRAKYRKGDEVSFAEFRGALLRKQIPLCEYHHRLYHKGELLAYELKKIAGYKPPVIPVDRTKSEHSVSGDTTSPLTEA